MYEQPNFVRKVKATPEDKWADASLLTDELVSSESLLMGAAAAEGEALDYGGGTRGAPAATPAAKPPAASASGGTAQTPATAAAVPSDPAAYFGMFDGLPCPDDLATARFVFQITSEVEMCWLMACENGT